MRKIHGLALAIALLVVTAPPAGAQDETPSSLLLTRPGWEIGVQVAKYEYEEPAFVNLEGNRGGVVGAYSFTTPNLVYGRIDGRVSYGKLDYRSVGTGTSSDNPDWIAEARAVVGKDFQTSDRVAFSPYIGLGFRYLYNDSRGYSSTGAVGYRRYSNYWYVPIGVTVRMRAGDQWVFAPTVEYDAFIGGRQESKLADTGIPGLPNITNRQQEGRGYRIYLMAEGRRWAFGPWLHYWDIKDSDVSSGFFEPANWTREYGLELRYRF